MSCLFVQSLCVQHSQGREDWIEEGFRKIESQSGCELRNLQVAGL